MRMKYIMLMKSVSCSYLFLIWVMIRKNIPSFLQTMNRGVVNMSQNATKDYNTPFPLLVPSGAYITYGESVKDGA